MSILISGSLAYDTVFDHEDTFLNTIKGDAIDHLNVTFQASGMRRTIGGVRRQHCLLLKATRRRSAHLDGCWLRCWCLHGALRKPQYPHRWDFDLHGHL